MELEINGGTFEVTGNVVIELPDYMVMLEQKELNETLKKKDTRIIAAGRHFPSGDIVVLTSKGQFFTFNGDLFKGIEVFPTKQGTAISFDDSDQEDIFVDEIIHNASQIDITVLHS